MWRLLRGLILAAAFVAANTAAAGALVAAIVYQRLPPLHAVVDYRPKLPLRIYSRDGLLLGEFGEEKRRIVPYREFPEMLVAALLATEDERFFRHGGVDFIGMARAVWRTLSGQREGASTITMQVARNFYLKREQTVWRKIFEVMLAYKIERRLPKTAILELYMNQIYMGHGTFGFAAAAAAYYGKSLDDLTLAEAAVLAGVPKAPSRYNPRASQQNAKARQRHVLRRLRAVNKIDEADYLEAVSAAPPPVRARRGAYEIDAGHVAEEVRKIIYGHYGENAYERGFRVFTTVDSRLQNAATDALRGAVIAHQKRQPYPGPEKIVNIAGLDEAAIHQQAEAQPRLAGMTAAVLVSVASNRVIALGADGERYEITGDYLRSVKSALPRGSRAGALAAGGVVRLRQRDAGWEIVAPPGAEGALVALDPEDGAVLAMAGGYDFSRRQYNHATQAKRQPGSGLKPFIFSAALEKGFNPASIVFDSPFYLTAEETGSENEWEPKNYGGTFSGEISLREALKHSKNLAAIRLLRLITPRYAQDFLTRFGFRRADHPPYLTMGLGAGAATPLEMAQGYAVFANGGFFVKPYLIMRVEDYEGNVLERELDYQARRSAIDPRNAFIMTSMLQSVIRGGTGRGAMDLGRGDLAGKTGTTNDTVDAWFCGFGGNITAVAWIGYDQPRTLGEKETGGRAALPMWTAFMARALENRPEVDYLQPPGVIVARVNAKTGRLAAAADEDAGEEFFYQEFLPAAEQNNADDSGGGDLF